MKVYGVKKKVCICDGLKEVRLICPPDQVEENKILQYDNESPGREGEAITNGGKKLRVLELKEKKMKPRV